MMRRLLMAIEGLRMLWAFRNRQWMRRWPFLPILPWPYVEWRLETLYATKPKGWAHALRLLWCDRRNAVRFLLWRRDMRLMQHRRRHGRQQ
jgi:hypothetical protein